MLNKDELDYMKKVLDANDRRLAEMDNHMSYLQANNSVMQSYYEKLADWGVEEDGSDDVDMSVLERFDNLTDSLILRKALAIALQDEGEKEIRGSKHNPEIVKYWSAIDGLNVSDDEIPYCSSAMNYWVAAAGGSPDRKANARSWLNFGKQTMNPKTGDLVVFWRGSRNSWQGHIGFYINTVNSEYINVFGANQSNSVRFSNYSMSRVLEYRTL